MYINLQTKEIKFFKSIIFINHLEISKYIFRDNSYETVNKNKQNSFLIKNSDPLHQLFTHAALPTRSSGR